jgi:hypothetical protein
VLPESDRSCKVIKQKQDTGSGVTYLTLAEPSSGYPERLFLRHPVISTVTLGWIPTVRQVLEGHKVKTRHPGSGVTYLTLAESSSGSYPEGLVLRHPLISTVTLGCVPTVRQVL